MTRQRGRAPCCSFSLRASSSHDCKYLLRRARSCAGHTMNTKTTRATIAGSSNGTPT